MEALPALDYKVFCEQQKAENDALRHELAQLKKVIFGSRREWFEPTSPKSSQPTLDVAIEEIAKASETETKEVSITQIRTIKANHSSRALSTSHLFTQGRNNARTSRHS